MMTMWRLQWYKRARGGWDDEGLWQCIDNVRGHPCDGADSTMKREIWVTIVIIIFMITISLWSLPLSLPLLAPRGALHAMDNGSYIIRIFFRFFHLANLCCWHVGLHPLPMYLPFQLRGKNTLDKAWTSLIALKHKELLKSLNQTYKLEDARFTNFSHFQFSVWRMTSLSRVECFHHCQACPQAKPESPGERHYFHPQIQIHCHTNTSQLSTEIQAEQKRQIGQNTPVHGNPAAIVPT